MRRKDNTMPLSIVASAILFNTINGSLNAYYLAYLTPNGTYGADWIFSGSFYLGLLLFLGGAVINLYSDKILLSLRSAGDTHYSIPHGFLFKYVSCPNHLGEIIEWIGFAIMAWNLPALSFAIWTYANLVPRSWRHHQWYHKHFENYPKNRKAVIPFIL
jgi:steroid 5-alpha reductase family enzyme